MKVVLTAATGYRRGKVVEIATIEGLMALASSVPCGVVVSDRYQRQSAVRFYPPKTNTDIKYEVMLYDETSEAP